MIGLEPGGYVRNVDPLGRVVLPIEWRRTFAVEPGAPMEIISGRDGSLLIKRYVPSNGCTFCGELQQIRQVAGRPICGPCITRISESQEPG